MFEFTEYTISLTVALDLEEDKIGETQLGSRVIVNKTPQSQYSPRELVTEKESFRGHFFFNIRCPRQPLIGKFTRLNTSNDAKEVLSACRVTLDASFASRLTSRKFKRALITVSFYDNAVVNLDPDDDENEVAIDEAAQFTPRILAFEPRQWRGPEDIREGRNTSNAQVNLVDPTTGLGFSGQWERTRPVIVPGQAEINGSIRGMTSSVVEWTLAQNALRNTGIIPQFSLPIVVQYTPGRPFAARVTIKAEVEWGFEAIAAGKLDDPIKFDPDRLGKSGDDTELNVDMSRLCNIEGYGGYNVVKGSGLEQG
ncbi:hypothetical protein N7476_010980 [Penicillium atrosanguineum]|uniref:Uncharacterized protein n=1 Tax=Penicillium atrosanguineum TaxID=1132637 RepID=A0A9W9PPU8_9EURO|nr:hypothetical protein N7526_010261 [Penicillium atrosanguineum]KAJ5299423.1 hypothetical protein N7476_010980 [Penicillium atrosanguineum]